MNGKRILLFLLTLWISAGTVCSRAELVQPFKLDPEPGFQGGVALVLLNSSAGFCGYGGWEYRDQHQYYFRTLTADGYGEWKLYDSSFGEEYHTLKAVYDTRKGENGFDSTGRAMDWQSAYCVEMGVDLDGQSQPEAEDTEFSEFAGRLRKYNPDGWKGLCLTVLYGCTFQGEIYEDGGMTNIRMLTPFPDDFPQEANEVDWYMATNMILYEFVMGLRDLDGLISTSLCPAGADELKKELEGSPAERVYDWMIRKIRQHAQAPSFFSPQDGSPAQIQLTWSEENQRYEALLEDTNRTELDLSSWTGEGLQIEKAGSYVYKVWTEEDIEQQTAAVQKLRSNLNGQNILLWNSGSQKQTLLTGTVSEEPLFFSGVFSTEKLPGQIEGMKTDEEGKGLQGVTIGLFQGEKEYARSITQSDGSWKFEEVPWGHYIVREIAALAGYEQAEQEYEVTVDRSHREIQIPAILNKVQKGSAKIVKKSEDGAAEGFEFLLEGISDTGKPIRRTARTDFTGKAILEDIPAGTYTLSEILNDETERYVPAESQLAVITSNSVTEVSFFNRLKKGKVQLIKADAEKPDRRLSGAVFEVSRDGQRIGILEEITPGFYVLDQLPAGSYELKEIKAPQFYAVDPGVYPFSITEDGEVINIENSSDGKIHGFFNRAAVGSLEIIKMIEEDDFRQTSPGGFRFSVQGRTDTGEEWNQVYDTDSEGRILIENLKTGEYTITELPSEKTEGMLLPEAQTVRIREGKKEKTEFENRWIRGDICLIKTDAEFPEHRLQGAVFEVQSLDGSVRKFLQERSDGSYRYEGLAYGNYVIREVRAPEHYILSDKAFPVEIRNDGEEIFIGAGGLDTVTNEPERGELIIHKEVEEDADLKISAGGFRFRVTGQADTGQTYDQTFITDESGNIGVKNLRTGLYTVSEITDEHMERLFDMPQDQTVRLEAGKKSEVFIQNKLRRGKLQIFKASAISAQQRLSGAEFVLEIMKGESPTAYTEVYQKKGSWTEIVSMKTGTDGTLEFAELVPGNYRLTETKPPEGYELLAEPIYFQIPSEEQMEYEISLNILNEPCYQLPDTGGNGIEGSLAVGAGLLGSAALVRKKRKRED